MEYIFDCIHCGREGNAKDGKEHEGLFYCATCYSDMGFNVSNSTFPCPHCGREIEVRIK